MLDIKPPRHYRAKAARAAQTGNREAAEQAEIGLRAAKAAKAIQLAVEGAPPLPPEIISALRDLLPPVEVAK